MNMKCLESLYFQCKSEEMEMVCNDWNHPPERERERDPIHYLYTFYDCTQLYQIHGSSCRIKPLPLSRAPPAGKLFQCAGKVCGKFQKRFVKLTVSLCKAYGQGWYHCNLLCQKCYWVTGSAGSSAAEFLSVTALFRLFCLCTDLMYLCSLRGDDGSAVHQTPPYVV